MHRWMWCSDWMVAVILAVLGVGVAAQAQAQVRSVTVRWQHPNPGEVAGFRLYVRDAAASFAQPSFDGLPIPDASGTYSASVAVADTASVLIAVSAYNASLQEGVYSNERVYAPAPASPAAPATPPAGGGGTGGSVSASAALFRVNAGGDAYTDAAGQNWEPDTAYANTGSLFYKNTTIAGTSDPELYRSQRANNKASVVLSYEFPVGAGRYRVRIHQAEVWSAIAAAGQRVFDVLAEGQTMLAGYDIYARAGKDTATVDEFEVDVLDGSLTLAFPAVVGTPRVGAIEVMKIPGGASVASPIIGAPGRPVLVMQ